MLRRIKKNLNLDFTLQLITKLSWVLFQKKNDFSFTNILLIYFLVGWCWISLDGEIYSIKEVNWGMQWLIEWILLFCSFSFLWFSINQNELKFVEDKYVAMFVITFRYVFLRKQKLIKIDEIIFFVSKRQLLSQNRTKRECR